MTDPTHLSTLANGLRVVEALIGRWTTMRELAAECGLPRQTTYRIVSTLITEGWVDRDGDRYRASPRLWSLAAQSFSFDDLRTAHAAAVRDLADTYGETVHLAVYDRGTAVYIDKADGSNPVGSYTTLGGRSPAYCVATGKVLLAFADATAQEAVLSGELEQHTPLTLADRSALRRELEQVRHDGYAVNRGEWRESVGGLAIPIYSPFNEVVAAIGFSGPTERLLPRVDELLLALRERTGVDGSVRPQRTGEHA
jgi:IclR family transcriptional regulator, KDG regulon repressor